MHSSSLQPYHERARSRGVSPLVYWPARSLVQPAAHAYFRLERSGLEHVPARGPVIIAANHRSFLDPFLIGLVTRRPVHYMTKKELFAHPLVGAALGALGAFPVERGAADAEMERTARAILARDGCLLVFPEGTRTRPGPPGRPRRGVGRLALNTGAPVVPVAVLGTDAARRGWRIRPHKARIGVGAPLALARVEDPTAEEARDATERIWTAVLEQWERLGGAAGATGAAGTLAGCAGRVRPA